MLLVPLCTTAVSMAAAIGLDSISPESAKCIECHKKDNYALYQQWGASKHFRGNVGCFECHKANEGEPDAFIHYEARIATLVTPKDCSRCHGAVVKEFMGSHHAKAGRIMGSLDNVLAEVVEGNRGMITPGFPEGNSAAAVNGCWQCHGSVIKVLPGGEGKLDPAMWPNTGNGRINPDGSEEVARHVTAATHSQPHRLATQILAANVTWDRITRRRKFTKSRSTESPFLRTSIK